MSEERQRQQTHSRLQAITQKGYVIVVTRAYGPNGEDLIDYDGPRFSGEPGVKVHVKQGDIEEDVILSPFYGDHSKVSTAQFVDGEPCELTVSGTDTPLTELPIKTADGSKFYAIYLTDKLERGELVAVNNVWGKTESRMIDELDVIALLDDED